MLVSQCTILLLSGVLVALCLEEITNKYHEDDNQIIKHLRASIHAKLFVRGCGAIYTELNVTAKNESDSFRLSKDKEYVFAIFTLGQVSLLISNKNDAEDKRYRNRNGDIPEVLFDITLGISKNSMAKLAVFVNQTKIDDIEEKLVPILPAIPYYVNVSITEHNISVYEAIAGISHPFLSFQLKSSSNLNLSSYDYFVKFKHFSTIYAHYDCCETCTPWMYIRISGCSKYSARTASMETSHLINYDNSPNQPAYVFNQNILVHHGGNPAFRAKIIFSQSENAKRNYYEVSLSDSPTILHYFNESHQFLKTLKPGESLKREYASAFIVNITITKSGIVSLRQPYEQRPFLTYKNQKHKTNVEPVNIKYMKMIKGYEDSVRYDFYHNCTDLRFFARKQKITIPRFLKVSQDDHSTDNRTDKYPLIWTYPSKQFNTTKYDVLHVFQDSYHIFDERSEIEVNSDYEDEQLPTDSSKSDETGTNSSKDGTGGSDYFKKTMAGAVSVLFIGMLKSFFQLNCVKNMMKELDVDDEKANELRKSVSNAVTENIANTLGIEE